MSLFLVSVVARAAVFCVIAWAVDLFSPASARFASLVSIIAIGLFAGSVSAIRNLDDLLLTGRCKTNARGLVAMTAVLWFGLSAIQFAQDHHSTGTFIDGAIIVGVAVLPERPLRRKRSGRDLA
jgi:hypothetical protein